VAYQDDPYARGAPPGGQPPYDDDAEPATRGDVRSLKRWLWAALVIGLVGCALGAIAIATDDEGEPDRSGARTATQVERRLNDQIDDLSRVVDDGATKEELDELSRRVDEVERAARRAQGGATDDELSQLSKRVDELEGRVDELEQQQDGGGAP
jgi:hypothetical protein